MNITTTHGQVQINLSNTAELGYLVLRDLKPSKLKAWITKSINGDLESVIPVELAKSAELYYSKEPLDLEITVPTKYGTVVVKTNIALLEVTFKLHKIEAYRRVSEITEVLRKIIERDMDEKIPKILKHIADSFASIEEVTQP